MRQGRVNECEPGRHYASGMRRSRVNEERVSDGEHAQSKSSLLERQIRRNGKANKHS